MEHYNIGKPRIPVNWTLFEQLYPKWQNGEITAVYMMKQLGLKPNTFYRRVKEYEGGLILKFDKNKNYDIIKEKEHL